MRVRLHRNLNAPNKVVEWSLTPLDGDKAYKGKVAAYVSEAELKNVIFRVQPAGVRAIRAKGQRSVVAWAEGELVSATLTRNRLWADDPQFTAPQQPVDANLVPVRFRVFEGFDTFTTPDDLPISGADTVVLTNTGGCLAEISALH
jgi:hypothetical protein